MQEVFTTEQVAELVGLDVKKDKWRVIKFAQSAEYGIKPSISPASGSGSRRLYDLQNACEIALALRLLEAGLRSKVIGKIIKQLRQVESLATKLRSMKDGKDGFFIVVSRTPLPGQSLDKARDQGVNWFAGGQLAKDFAMDFSRKYPDHDLILVPLRRMFLDLDKQLRKLSSKLKEGQR